jgi:Retrotransposon gag protein
MPPKEVRPARFGSSVATGKRPAIQAATPPVESPTAAANNQDDESDDEPVREPNMNVSANLQTPAPFTGGSTALDDLLVHCELNFVLKPRGFTDDKNKIYYLASHFKGGPFDWFKALFKNPGNAFDDYDVFVDRLKSIYGIDEQLTTREAKRKLQKLRQTKSASSYAAEFDSLTAILGIDNQSKLVLFEVGLQDVIKDALAMVDTDYNSYDELREAVIKIDARQHERSLAKRSSDNSRSSDFKSRGSQPSNNNTSSNFAPRRGPSQSNTTAPRGPLSAEVKEHRIKNKLCLYCGKAGHVVADCRAKPKGNNISATLPNNVLPKN